MKRRSVSCHFIPCHVKRLAGTLHDQVIVLRRLSVSSRHRRRGWTLIELLIAMSLTMVLASTSALLVIRFLKANSTQTSEVTRSRSLNLWLEQFRSDAHQSTSAEIHSTPTGDPRVVFHQQGHTTSYTMHPESIVRQYDGEPGGGWSIGQGRWMFTLQMDNRLIHGEFTPQINAPAAIETPQNVRVPLSLRPRMTVVEAAIGLRHLNTKGDGLP